MNTRALILAIGLLYSSSYGQWCLAATTGSADDELAIEKAVYEQVYSADATKLVVTEYYGQHQKLPSSCAEVRSATWSCDPYISIGPEGQISVTLNSLGIGLVAGKFVFFTPSPNENGDVVWMCTSTAPARLLPPRCHARSGINDTLPATKCTSASGESIAEPGCGVSIGIFIHAMHEQGYDCVSILALWGDASSKLARITCSAADGRPLEWGFDTGRTQWLLKINSEGQWLKALSIARQQERYEQQHATDGVTCKVPFDGNGNPQLTGCESDERVALQEAKTHAFGLIVDHAVVIDGSYQQLDAQHLVQGKLVGRSEEVTTLYSVQGACNGAAANVMAASPYYVKDGSIVSAHCKELKIVP